MVSRQNHLRRNQPIEPLLPRLVNPPIPPRPSSRRNSYPGTECRTVDVFWSADTRTVVLFAETSDVGPCDQFARLIMNRVNLARVVVDGEGKRIG